MATKTKTRKKSAPAKPRKKAKARGRKASVKKAASAVRVKAIAGLKGQGLLSLGGKSKLELRDILAMARPMFGRVVDVSERTIADAESGKTAKKLMRNYNEVYRLVEALSEVVDRESLGLWFRTPNESFDGLKPIEVIERGEIDRLWNMVFQLQTGMPG
jgi:DNA-binding XRE family transcriptional regulator